MKCPSCQIEIPNGSAECRYCRARIDGEGRLMAFEQPAPETGETNTGGTRRCPFCAEEIQAAAIKCRFCHERLDGPLPSAAPSGGRREETAGSTANRIQGNKVVIGKGDGPPEPAGLQMRPSAPSRPQHALDDRKTTAIAVVVCLIALPFVIVWLLPDCEPEPTNRPVAKAPHAGPRRDSGRLVPYDIIDEQAGEDGVKTQVELRVVIGRDTTRAQLDRLMRHIYEQQARRTGFEVREHPNAIYAFFYSSRQIFENDPTGWIGRIEKSAADGKPRFDNNLIEGGAIEQVTKAMKLKADPGPQDETARMDTDGETVVYTSHLTDSGKYMDLSDKRGMWMRVFIGLDLLFTRASKLDKLSYREIHEGKTVVQLELTRALWDAMAYSQALREVGEREHKLDEAFMANRIGLEAHARKVDALYLAGFKNILDRLPKEKVTIAKGLKP